MRFEVKVIRRHTQGKYLVHYEAYPESGCCTHTRHTIVMEREKKPLLGAVKKYIDENHNKQ